MQTLTYLLERPDNLDRGDVFFDALRNNITKNDVHSHNGVNSAKLNSDSLAKYVVTLTNSGWTVVGDGFFKKLVTMPGVFIWDETHIRAYVDGGALDRREIRPRFVRVSDTTFEVYQIQSNRGLKLKFV